MKKMKKIGVMRRDEVIEGRRRRRCAGERIRVSEVGGVSNERKQDEG